MHVITGLEVGGTESTLYKLLAAPRAGQVAPPRDSRTLVGAVLRLLGESDSSRGARSMVAWLRIVREFSVDTLAEPTNILLKELACLG